MPNIWGKDGQGARMTVDKAIEYLRDLSYEVYNVDSDGYDYDQALQMAIDALKSRKTGYIYFEEYPDGYYHSYCSECDFWFDESLYLNNVWNYCPNCGAKLEKTDR